MNRKMVCWFVLALFAVFSACSRNDFNIEPFTEGEAQITLYAGRKKAVRIPAKIQGMSITVIGDSAFSGKEIVSVTIPNSVTSIGHWAFVSNQLTSITIPNNVTYIGAGAFAGNILTSVIIPNNVTFISSWTFAYNQLTSITIPNNVTFIERNAFDGNQLTSIIIPNSVTSIGAGAFAGNILTKITIGSNVHLEKKDILSVEDEPDEFSYYKFLLNSQQNLGVFENGFDEFYEANEKKAGTYIFAYGKWSMRQGGDYEQENDLLVCVGIIRGFFGVFPAI